MDKQALKSAMRRTKKTKPIPKPIKGFKSFKEVYQHLLHKYGDPMSMPPQEPFSFQSSPADKTLSIKDMLGVTVVTEEDWKSVLAQAEQIPDREDLVWVRDDKGELLGAMINNPELVGIMGKIRGDDKCTKQ